MDLQAGWMIPCIVLAFLWWMLIGQLSSEWSVNPQYSYGYAVPWMCVYLAWRQWSRNSQENGESLSDAKSTAEDQKKEKTSTAFAGKVSSGWLYGMLMLAALSLGPTRLIAEANPEWRLVSWLLALEVVVATYSIVQLVLRTRNNSVEISRFAFPVFFFLVAVPWPTLIEAPVIQALTEWNSAATMEVLNWVGTPAVQHGNVIEISTGQVGVDEACSGIRSFQASLMISLFLGEFYSIARPYRWILCFVGFALALVFNIGRTFLLVSVAEAKGLDAISTWHDPAGITILLLCFCGLWLVALRFRANTKNVEESHIEERSTAQALSVSPCIRIPNIAWGFLLSWLLLVEIGVEWWYRSHEASIPRQASWTVRWPESSDSLKNVIIPEKTRQLLRYDEGKNATWRERRYRWQAIFLRWNPGRIAPYLAKNHTPESCLPAAGKKLESISALRWLTINGLALPFRSYVYRDNGRPVFVYYCLWEDRTGKQGFQAEDLTYDSRLAAVRLGRRHLGQRSLEIVLWGATDGSEAESALNQLLPRIISPGQNASNS